MKMHYYPVSTCLNPPCLQTFQVCVTVSSFSYVLSFESHSSIQRHSEGNVFQGTQLKNEGQKLIILEYSPRALHTHNS